MLYRRSSVTLLEHSCLTHFSAALERQQLQVVKFFNFSETVFFSLLFFCVLTVVCRSMLFLLFLLFSVLLSRMCW